MLPDLPEGFQRISGKANPPDDGPYFIQLRNGFVDKRIAYTAGQIRWIHGGHCGDVVAIQRLNGRSNEGMK